MIVLWSLLACKPEQPEDSGTSNGAVTLPLPDISDVDFPTSLQEALTMSVAITTGPVFDGNRTVLKELGRSGCPDYYAGVPPEEDFDADLSWMDHCITAGGLF